MKKLILLLMICIPVHAGFLLQNSQVTNRCPDPLWFDTFDPHNATSGTCQLGGAVNNPDSWGLLCDIDGLGLIQDAIYGGQTYNFTTTYNGRSGEACFFYGCNDDPLKIRFTCISNSIGGDATITVDTENDSMSAMPTP